MSLSRAIVVLQDEAENRYLIKNKAIAVYDVFVDSRCGYIGYSQAAGCFHFPVSALSHQDMEVKHMHSMQNVCKTNLHANDYGTERGLNWQVFHASTRKVAVDVGQGISLDFGTGR